VPNNRQLAIGIWALIALILILVYPNTRHSLRSLVRIALKPNILVSLALLCAWTLGLVVIGRRLGAWTPSLAADTGFWLVSTGLVLFFNFSQASTQPHFFRSKALATLQVAVVVEVFSELAVMNLIAEFLLVPTLVFLGGMSAVAGSNDEYRAVKRLFDGLILIISLTLLVYVTVVLVHTWNDVDWANVGRQFGLPLWLTLGVLPYIYALALYAAYELASTRMGWRSSASRWARLRNQLALLTAFHVRAYDLNEFSGRWQLELAEADSFRAARGVIRDFHTERQRAAQAEVEAKEREAEAKERLARYAGSEEVDADGRRLDRREFDATTRALRWLATCHMGWFTKQSRYRADLLTMLGDDFSYYGVEVPSGITMEVSTDGQSWYAWRRTITGWVFGIGASAPPPDQWLYDGEEPPAGYPRQDPVWGSDPFDQEAGPNW
jgi:hypothetical protein